MTLFKTKPLVLIFLFSVSQLSCGQENIPKIEVPKNINYSYEVVVNDIEVPWGISFISKGEFLVTEQSGKLFLIKNGIKNEVTGLPPVYFRDQGGLLDVAIHPNFSENKLVYLTMSTNLPDNKKGGNTGLFCGKLEGLKLKNIKILYKATPDTKSVKHWGSRIVFDNNGHVFFSIGDRGNRDLNPQDISRDAGKIYRLNLDGTIPDDNPFLSESNAKKAIYSYGHRNPQGMTINPKTGEIWEHEHGPRGGDEINIIKSGFNYGWPKVTYGKDYLDYFGTSPLGKKTTDPKVEEPFYYWIPSIAPSGMAFSTSNVYDGWKDNLFVGSLKFQYLERIIIKENKVVKRQKILDGIGRVRSVVEGPEGYLYIGVEGKGVLKILPKND